MTKYIPVFVGYAHAGERVALYKGTDAKVYVMLYNDGTWRFHELGPNAVVFLHYDYESGTELMHLHLQSAEWSGMATGTRNELSKEKTIQWL